MRPLSEFSKRDIIREKARLDAKKLSAERAEKRQNAKLRLAEEWLKRAKTKYQRIKEGTFFLRPFSLSSLHGWEFFKKISLVPSYFKKSFYWCKENSKIILPICAGVLLLGFSPLFVKGCRSCVAAGTLSQEEWFEEEAASKAAEEEALLQEEERLREEKRLQEEELFRLQEEEARIEKERLARESSLTSEEREEARKKALAEKKLREERAKKLAEEIRQKELAEKKLQEERAEKLAEEEKKRQERVAREKAEAEEKKLRDEEKARKEKELQVERQRQKELDAKLKVAEAEASRAEKLKAMSADELNDLGDEAIDVKKWDQAQEYTSLALGKDDNSWRANRNQGRILENDKNYKMAKDFYEKAVEAKIDQAQLWYEYGRVLYRLTDYSIAVSAFDKAISYKSDFRQAAFNKALSLEKLNRIKEAITAFEQTSVIDPKHGSSWYWLGELNNREGNYEKAIPALLRAVHLSPKNSAYWGTLGFSYFHVKKYDDAEAAFNQSLKINPKNVASYYNLANVKMEKKEFADAYGYAVKAAELRPDGEYLYKAGVIAQNLGKDDEALKYYERAQKAGVSDLGNLVNLGALYDSKGRFDEAIVVLKQAYGVAPKSREVNYNLANVYFHKEDYNNAKAHYQVILNEDKRDFQARFFLAISLMKEGFLPAAKGEFLRVIIDSPTYYDAYYHLGQVYYILREGENAKKILQKLLLLKPDYPNVDEINKMLGEL